MCVCEVSLQVCLKGLLALCSLYRSVAPSVGNIVACKIVCVCYLWTGLLVRLVTGSCSSFLLGVLQQIKRLIRCDTDIDHEE